MAGTVIVPIWKDDHQATAFGTRLSSLGGRSRDPIWPIGIFLSQKAESSLEKSSCLCERKFHRSYMMINTDKTFLEYLILAQAEALTERETHLLNARYGFTGGSPQTLEALAQEINLSRERVRQLLQRALRKLRHRGKRDIEKGNNATACASLLLYVGYGTDPGTQLKDKFMAFAHSALPALPLETHALPLLAGLCLSEKDTREFLGKPALRQMDYRENKDQRSTKENMPMSKPPLQHQGESEDSTQILTGSTKKSLQAFNILLAEIRWPRETSSGLRQFSLLIKSNPLQAQEHVAKIDERRFF